MNLGIERRKIEDKIVTCYSAINFDVKKHAWVDGKPLEDFIFSFFELRKYYENSDDTAVGLDTFRVYMAGLRSLQTAAAERAISIDRRETAERLIYELNYQVEAVMYELDQNRQRAEAQDAQDSTDSDGSGGVPVPM